MSAQLDPASGYASPFKVRHQSYRRGEHPAKGRTHWDYAERSMALWVYGETGSFETASRQSGVPVGTIKTWIERDDGSVAQEMEDLRLAVRAKGAHMAAAIGIQAMDALAKRLTQGDPHCDRHGNVYYLPVKAKDCAWVASIMIDKHALLTGMSSQGKANASLLSLADKLLAAIQAQGAPSPPPPSPSPTVEPETLDPLAPGTLG